MSKQQTVVVQKRSLSSFGLLETNKKRCKLNYVNGNIEPKNCINTVSPSPPPPTELIHQNKTFPNFNHINNQNYNSFPIISLPIPMSLSSFNNENNNISFDSPTFVTTVIDSTTNEENMKENITNFFNEDTKLLKNQTITKAKKNQQQTNISSIDQDHNYNNTNQNFNIKQEKNTKSKKIMKIDGEDTDVRKINKTQIDLLSSNDDINNINNENKNENDNNDDDNCFNELDSTFDENDYVWTEMPPVFRNDELITSVPYIFDWKEMHEAKPTEILREEALRKQERGHYVRRDSLTMKQAADRRRRQNRESARRTRDRVRKYITVLEMHYQHTLSVNELLIKQLRMFLKYWNENSIPNDIEMEDWPTPPTLQECLAAKPATIQATPSRVNATKKIINDVKQNSSSKEQKRRGRKKKTELPTLTIKTENDYNNDAASQNNDNNHPLAPTFSNQNINDNNKDCLKLNSDGFNDTNNFQCMHFDFISTPTTPYYSSSTSYAQHLDNNINQYYCSPTHSSGSARSSCDFTENILNKNTQNNIHIMYKEDNNHIMNNNDNINSNNFHYNSNENNLLFGNPIFDPSFPMHCSNELCNDVTNNLMFTNNNTFDIANTIHNPCTLFDNDSTQFDTLPPTTPVIASLTSPPY